MSTLSATASKLSATRLIIAAYAEALCVAPLKFLTASMWWLLRKRVRARGQFALLIGRTSRAYAYWCLQKDNGLTNSDQSGQPRLVALVGTATDGAALDRTLRSLALEGIAAHLVGSDIRADLARAARKIDWSCLPWLMPISAGDLLAPGAADAYRQAIKVCSHDVIYVDDDVLDSDGVRRRPYFKPRWNSELFRHHDYLTGACIIKVNSAGLTIAADAAEDWAGALVNAAVASGGGATHMEGVFHHRQTRRCPRFPLPKLRIAEDLPRMTVIVPTRNRLDLLSACISGLDATNYPDLEVVVVDNDSDDPATLAFLAGLPMRAVRVLRHVGPFNYSAINNHAVAEATGELICLLNNDIEVLGADWLAMMATQAMREEVGAVGAKLLYSNGRIQHAGVVIGMGNAAGHAHRLLEPDQEGYFHRHNLPQFVSAVTAACLVVKRERFLAVGGLDAANFPVAFNDVDLCLRLNSRGWHSLYEPRAVLVHHESLSRGFDRDSLGAARFARELAALKRLWHTDRVTDPFHHPQLSRATEQFALGL